MRLLPFAESFARLVDARFAFTVGVSARVARYAEELGRVVGLSDMRLKQLQVAALLHDVGQLSMSERVLSKPGILSVEELGALHLHTIYSRDVVAGIAGLEEVADWVEAHHERIDGRGYPEGRSRRGDPAGGAHPGGGGRLRGDHVRPAAPAEGRGQRGDGAAARRRGHAAGLRPGGRVPAPGHLDSPILQQALQRWRRRE